MVHAQQVGDRVDYSVLQHRHYLLYLCDVVAHYRLHYYLHHAQILILEVHHLAEERIVLQAGHQLEVVREHLPESFPLSLTCLARRRLPHPYYTLNYYELFKLKLRMTLKSTNSVHSTALEFGGLHD